MRITELRKRLKDIKNTYGDIDVILYATAKPYGSVYADVSSVVAGENGYNRRDSNTVLIR